MKIGAVIPARYGSTRFPGKPLTKIAGKTMIEHVYRRVSKVLDLDEVIVATDDARIVAEVTNFGGVAQLTDSSLATGTDRVWAIVASRTWGAVINVQGDEPLISTKLIVELVKLLRSEQHAVVTAASSNKNYNDFLSPHVVKTVLAMNGNALYFSRAPIPHNNTDQFLSFFHHIGIYGYTYAALKHFVGHPQTELEKKERLEQLRFLETGINIHVVQTDYHSYGVDVPTDVIKIEALLREEHA